MTINLKAISAKLAETKAELAAIGSRLAEAGAKRDALVAEIQNLDAGIEAAELTEAAPAGSGALQIRAHVRWRT